MLTRIGRGTISRGTALKSIVRGIISRGTALKSIGRGSISSRTGIGRDGISSCCIDQNRGGRGRIRKDTVMSDVGRERVKSCIDLSCIKRRHQHIHPRKDFSFQVRFSSLSTSSSSSSSLHLPPSHLDHCQSQTCP